MSGESECPHLNPTVLAYTTEVAAARPWAIVTGSGPTPDDALEQLRDEAKEQGRQIFEQLWRSSSGSKSQWQKKMAALKTQVEKGARMIGAFTVGSTRMAYGQQDGKPCWIAYGTLLTDNSGDGFSWLQWEQTSQDGQGTGSASQDGAR